MQAGSKKINQKLANQTKPNQTKPNQKNLASATTQPYRATMLGSTD